MSFVTNYVVPAAFIVFPHIGGLAGAFATRNEIKTWYRNLKLAPWNPPNWVFGPVWTCLYTAMGYASWLIYKEVGFESIPIYLYAAQLALNWIWSPLFFIGHRVGLSLINVLVSLGLVVGCITSFNPISPLASYLMIPYAAWICLATSLNFYVWFYNDSRTIRGEGIASAPDKSKSK